MATFSVVKDPDAILDYRMDWVIWLNNDTIASATVTSEAGLTLDSESNTTISQTAWLSGGTAGQDYDVVFEVATTAGRTEQRTLTVIARNL